MEKNEDKIINTLEGGQRLVDSGNLYSPKVKDKINSIQDRSEKCNNVRDKYSYHDFCFKFIDIILCPSLWLLFDQCYLTMPILNLSVTML